MSVVQRLHTLLKSAFFKNIALLASGTLLAQIITISTTPVLSRLFLPAAFGVLGMLNSVVNILAGVSALRYNMAMVLPDDDDDAANLLSLSLGLISTLTLLIALVVLVGRQPLATQLGQPDAANWLWWLPPMVLITGLFQTLSFWCTRKKAFKRTSISQVAGSAVSASSKISAGVAAVGTLGLVAGQVLGSLIGTLVLLTQVLREDLTTLRRAFSLSRIKALARTFADFPRYNAPATLIHGLTNGLPVILFGLVFDATAAGLYSVAYLICRMPVQLLASAVYNVFFQRASERLNAKSPLFAEHKQTTFLLAAVGILPAIIAAWLAPWVFTLGLGEEWTGAGVYARYLLIFLYFELMAIPSSALIPVLNRQRWFLGWQSVSLVFSISGIALGFALGSPVYGVFAYSVAKALMFIWLTLSMTRKVRAVDQGEYRAYAG
ncbi:oligosaccharide flippase family protein [Lujinxingia litoralis]|uniref:oligosaccharide flippase family protein n=1 Tax=Lujinxingia litoralis TaxID=2211119 RepID=UPI0013144F19|nr:oligosaccharide flippase family protein [Lujinxingia litoralis]